MSSYCPHEFVPRISTNNIWTFSSILFRKLSFFCMIIRCRFSTEGKNAEINRPVFTFYTIFMPLHMLEDDLFAKLSSFLTQRHFRFCQWFLVFGVEMSITLKNLLHLLMINKNSCHILIPSLCLKCAAKSLINRPSFP